MITRIYRYVLMYDRGMAPNPRGGLVTLATCKPQIRRHARAGDWVMGNFPSPTNELVAWAGKIARCIPVGEYPKEFPDREDALYETGSDGRTRRIEGKLPWYHRGEDQQRRDCSGNVLMFDMASCWYFGSDGREIPQDLEHLIARGIGHRVNGRRPGDLERLQQWLNEQAPPGVHGGPRDGWDGPNNGGCGPGNRPKPNGNSDKSC